jgi:hypothetical protein
MHTDPRYIWIVRNTYQGVLFVASSRASANRFIDEKVKASPPDGVHTERCWDVVRQELDTSPEWDQSE